MEAKASEHLQREEGTVDDRSQPVSDRRSRHDIQEGEEPSENSGNAWSEGI